MSHDLIELTPQGELNFHFHAGQWQAINSKRRIVAIVAGSQSGKTSFAPIWLWNEIKNCGPGDYGFIAPTYKLLEVKALPEFRRLFQDILALGEYTGSPVQRFVFSKSGAKRTFGYEPNIPTVIYFGHAQNPDSLESATYRAVVLDEAGQEAYKRESWEAIQRRLIIHRGRILICTTPYTSAHWLKTDIIDKFHAGDPRIELVTFASTMNPQISQEEIDEKREPMPWWRFAMFYLGQMTRPAGQIFDVFTDAHRIPRFTIPTHWKRYLGIDFGGVHTCGIFLAEDPKTSRRYAYREYLAGGRTAAEHVKYLLDGEGVIPICVGGSHSEGQWRDEFRAAGLPVREPDQKLVEVGIDRVYGEIKADNFYVFDDLVGLLGEFGSYSRVLDADAAPTEEIRDKSSYHHLDATRYIVGWLNRKGTKMQTSSVDFYAKPTSVQHIQTRSDAEIEELLEAA